MNLLDNLQNISKEELIKILLQQDQSILIKDQCILQQKKQIQFLEEQAQAYLLRQFANKSEKFNISQASFFDEAVLPKSEEKLLSQEEEITVASYVRNKKPGRKALPFNR
jgi:NhaP-type Na+/H+ and K+/H+ antiporter